MKPDDKAPRGSIALVRAASNVMSRAAGPVAGLVGTIKGMPYLGGGVALGLGTALLGVDALRGIDSSRVRLALRRIFEDDDWTDYIAAGLRGSPSAARPRHLSSEISGYLSNACFSLRRSLQHCMSLKENQCTFQI